MRVVFRLPGIRRAPGPQGFCAGFALHQFETDNAMYISATGEVTSWPTSLQVMVSLCYVDLSNGADAQQINVLCSLISNECAAAAWTLNFSLSLSNT